MSRRYLLNVIISALAAMVQSQPANAQTQPQANEVSISAASDLQFVLPELVKLYNSSTTKFSLRFGASGTLSTQIVRGLNTDIFLSADAAQVEKLRAAALAADQPFVYAQGHIALAALQSTPLEIDQNLQGVKAFFAKELAAGRQVKLAIANPLHAPYGMAAQQALESIKLWDIFKSNLVLGENVSQTAQFVASGSASAGIIGLAQCKAPVLEKVLKCKELAQSTYKPILQTAVLVKNGHSSNIEAAKFLAFLKSPGAKALLTQHGFSAPQQ